MKLAISNIGWHPHEEIAVAGIMRDMNVKGVEIAPTKVWDSPLAASDAEVKDYRQFWESRRIQIVAMQSLLFGRSDLTIFDSAQKRDGDIFSLSLIETPNFSIFRRAKNQNLSS